MSANAQASMCATLVAQWSALGVDTAFVAPGSRSTPMALALERDPQWRVEVMIDERSVAFAALGHALAAGRPAVALCTSGTAAAHFHAAVIEAGLSGVPMIVVTADRPPELRDVGAAQTIDQTKLFGSAVRWFHDPDVADWSVADRWPALAAQCLHAATGERPGPVHLNLPFREPLLGEAEVTDSARVAIRSSRGESRLDDHALASLAQTLTARRGVILAGRGSGDAVDELATALGWPILAEARAACGGANVVRHFDSIVRAAGDSIRPEVVLRLGESPASKVTAQWLAASEALQVHVSGTGDFFDPDRRVGAHVAADPTRFARDLAAIVSSCDSAWGNWWRDREVEANAAVAHVIDESSLSGPWVARRLVEQLPTGSHLVVSSSMPIRDLEWFAGRCDHLVVHANRGANGIDGVIATAIGVATATSRPVGVLIGDVAFVHDTSSLAGLVRRGLDVRIVVVDNDGGGIFHYLPQAAEVDSSSFEKLFGTPHGSDLVALALAHGIASVRVESTDAKLIDARGPSVTVVPTDRRRDLEVHRALHSAVAASFTA